MQDFATRSGDDGRRAIAVGAGSVAAAVAVRLLLGPTLGGGFPFATLFLAVLLSAAVGGLGSALLATGLGALAAILLLLPGGLGLTGPGRVNLAGLLLYLAVSGGIAAIGGALRDARRRADATVDQVAAERERLQVTLQSIGDAVIATDGGGLVSAMNPVAEQLTGWRLEEARGRPLGEVFRIVNEETRAPVPCPVGRVIDEGSIVRLANHTVLVARDGRETPIDDSASPIRDREGRLVGVVLVFRDVGERRAAEDRLLRSERDLDDFFENANVGLHWVGPDGTILRVNQCELDLLGYARGEYVGRHIAEFHVDRPVIDDILRRLAAGETLTGLPARLRCKDGSIKDVLINSSVLWDQGRFLHTRCFTLDVTEVRRIEESRALLAAAVASSEDAIVTKTLDGTITSWNGAAERLFEYTAQEAVGQPITLIVPPDRRDEETAILERLRRGERIEHYETVRVAKSGRRMTISLSISPVHDPSGRIVGASKVARDVTERKRVEERLRTLAAVVEQSHDFIGICDTDLVPIFVNEAGRRMVGLDSMEEARRAAVLDCFWPEDRPIIEREALPALRRDGRWRGEIRFRHFKTGVPIHTIWNVTAIRDGAGAPIAWATVSPNLDTLKATERALEESRAQLAEEAAALHRLHELSSRLMVSAELSPALDDILATAIDLLAADKGNVQILDEATGSLRIAASRGFEPAFLERFAEVTQADSAACARALRNRARVLIEDVESDEEFAPQGAAAAEAGYRAVQSTPLLGRDGRVLGVLSTHFAHPCRPSEGRLRLLDLHARLAAELIERTRNEATLRESEERFRTLADNISQFAWMADAKGWIFWYNRRWFEYTGTTLEEMQGWGWTKVHHPDHVDRVVARIQRSWDTGEVWEDTFPLRGKDGTYRWFLSRATPIRDAAGRVLRWFGTNTDITDQREAEEALRDADRRKDEFLATLAHELRNPLAPVRNSLEIMKRAAGNEAVIERARATIDRQMAHLERLVDDLLDVSRITRDKLELRLVAADLSSIVQHAIETCRPLVDASRHELIVSLPAEPIRLRADPVRLTQVVSNLLSNASKYTDPRGRIRLTARRNGKEVALSVEDTGVGIAPEMLPRVFDMFTQAPAAADRVRGGLGIGLTLVRRLVEMHGGRVDAFSEGIGRGSEFVVRLPIAEDGEVVAAEAAPIDPRAGLRRRILIVDDNRDAADSLGMLLSIFGHETRLAYDGEAAVQAAAEFRPDLALLDIGLPKLSGHEVARRIREQPWGKSMVLVALTGWGQEQDRRKSLEIGFDRHLVKPVDIDALTALLASLDETRPAPEAAR